MMRSCGSTSEPRPASGLVEEFVPENDGERTEMARLLELQDRS